MQLWSPIRAHAEWIARFREALYDRSRPPPEAAADPERCELGRWLMENEVHYGHLRSYRDARALHARFHRRAAHCLHLAAAGRRTEALAETADAGELRRLSRRLVRAFQDLKRDIARRPAEAPAPGLESAP